MEGEAVGAVAARVLCGGRAEGRAGSNGVQPVQRHGLERKGGEPGTARPARGVQHVPAVQ